MTRYQAMFAELQRRNEGAFVPFVTLGDPNLEATPRVLSALIDGGADALELGLPFTDPVADGPVIQAANTRALENGFRVADAWTLIRELRDQQPKIPIGLLVYGNLVMAPGLDQFYGAAAEAGVDSVLVADVPVAESAPFVKAATDRHIDPVLILPPDATPELLEAIAHLGRGYTYALARAGVTGTQSELTLPGASLYERLQVAGAAPPLVGFGITRPEHVRQAVEAGAAGAISGSAVVRLLSNYSQDPESCLASIRSFVADMKSATRPQ